MIYREPPPDPIGTVFLIAEAPLIERARQGLSEFGNAEGWISPGELLRRGAVSPSGELPPTHFFCVITLARSTVQRLAAFISQKRLPISAEIMADEEARLTALGLKRIVAP